MVDTQQLIDTLSREAARAHMTRPALYAARLLAVLGVYAVLTQALLGFRGDLATQLGRPLFLVELLLLGGLLVSATGACVLAMYPDLYQRRSLLKLPYWFSAGIMGLVAFQCFMPQDARMLMRTPTSHSIECTMFIAAAAVLPSALIFVLLKKGATLVPWHAGALAVMTAWSIGALTLRLGEGLDEIGHLLMWHYLPTIGFALLGALLGRSLLKW